ncbi:MAG: tetratricopeptide repeat-containing sulfotransferase family protein [Phycisphaerae bacterium]
MPPLQLRRAKVGLNIISGAPGSSVSPGTPWIPPHPVPLDAELHRARALFQSGHVLQSRDAYTQLTRSYPFEWHLYWAIGICELRLGQLREAEGPLRRAVELNPNAPLAHSWLGEWFLRKAMIPQALHHTQLAAQLDPNDPTVLETRAWTLEAAGHMDEAWQIATSLQSRGNLSPSLARLLGRLAPKFKAEKAALHAINHLIAKGLSPEDANLHFTAAALLDREGHYEQAFHAAQKGNAARRHQPYNPAEIEAEISRLLTFFSKDRLDKLSTGGAHSERPVFIVGMPRSGTSLVEQILASHPNVHGAGELELAYEMLLSAIRLSQGQYPDCLESLSQSQINQLGEEYLWSLVHLAPPHATRVTNKMPLNFTHLGLIQMTLPGARIIYIKRNPLDTCLSCFMTDFNVGNEFKYALPHLAHFYKQHQRLISHWKQTLRLPLLEIEYEQLVKNTEPETRRMLTFLNLPWHDNCKNFHQTHRTVATASVQQVREPIYDRSINRWKHYQPWLNDLISALSSRTI